VVGEDEMWNIWQIGGGGAVRTRRFERRLELVVAKSCLEWQGRREGVKGREWRGWFCGSFT
jgi:hypothetical protein